MVRKWVEHSRRSGGASKFVRHMVYGGLDGVISTFALIAATAGAGLPTAVLLMLGFANLVADAISMTLGSFLSHKAECDHILRERAREKW
jgi:vacuolar iron transporter family protein